jgi:hypothetical protein
VTSDSEVINLALARLALDDNVGAKLVARKGRLPADLPLAIED